jgi:hypothetical protein
MKSTISIVSNVWIRQIELESKGDEMFGHSHTFDHQHLLSVGTIEVQIGEARTEYTAPAILFIPKGTEHSIVAISEYVLGHCIHPIRDGYRVEDIVDPINIPLRSAPMILDTMTGEPEKCIDEGASPFRIDSKELEVY